VSRRLVLWRHGRTAWNAQGRAQGQHDVPLDDVGVGQAREAAARLASLVPAAIVSSDLRRAADTAAELGRLTGLEVSYDRRLREVDFGEREGLTLEESFARFPDETTGWLRAEDVRFPGGETYRETAERFAGALSDVVAALGARDTAVVVAHGGAMRVGTGRFLGIPASLWEAFGGFANCNWAVLAEGRRGWRIDEWNAGSLPEPVMGDDEPQPVAPSRTEVPVRGPAAAGGTMST
jgi:glucosyl-3-phosphoglycerate phosphatase